MGERVRGGREGCEGGRGERFTQLIYYMRRHSGGGGSGGEKEACQRIIYIKKRWQLKKKERKKEIGTASVAAPEINLPK